MPLPDGVRAVLLDIEGTTTPITFVTEVLFSYARERIERTIATSAQRPEVAEAVRLLREEHAGEAVDGRSAPLFGDGSPYALHLMDFDRKSTGLKVLQGLIWEDGYRDRSLQGAVFDDVPRAVSAWQVAGIRVRIYSSGSVLAQQLLFRHSTHGDLLPWIEWHHDTTTGPKREAASYKAIAESMGLAPEAIMFLSDVVEELNAAREAGFRTGLMRRPGNKPCDAGTHAVYETFEPLM